MRNAVPNSAPANSSAQTLSAADLSRRYARLELALIDAATASLSGSGVIEGAPLVSAETAIKILMLRSSAEAKDRTTPKAADIEPNELRRNLTARITAVRRATAKPTKSSGHQQPPLVK